MQGEAPKISPTGGRAASTTPPRSVTPPAITPPLSPKYFFFKNLWGVPEIARLRSAQCTFKKTGCKGPMPHSNGMMERPYRAMVSSCIQIPGALHQADMRSPRWGCKTFPQTHLTQKANTQYPESHSNPPPSHPPPHAAPLASPLLQTHYPPAPGDTPRPQ